MLLTFRSVYSPFLVRYQCREKKLEKYGDWKVVVSEAFSLAVGILNRNPQIQAVVNYKRSGERCQNLFFWVKLIVEIRTRLNVVSVWQATSFNFLILQKCCWVIDTKNTKNGISCRNNIWKDNCFIKRKDLLISYN